MMIINLGNVNWFGPSQAMSLNESLTFGPGAMVAASYALEGQETSFGFFFLLGDCNLFSWEAGSTSRTIQFCQRIKEKP